MKNHCHHTTTIAKAHTGSALRPTAWLLLLFLFLPFFSPAQQASDYTVQANIIYHFTKYIDWPAAKKSGDFVIGVLGDSPLYEELQKSLANKSVGNQRIVVRKLTSVETAENCHILFVSEDMSSSMKKVVAQTAGKSVLLVSEKDGLAKKGACINFIIVSDRLKLEINKNTIQERNLSIASELLKLGKVIK
jgi:hypothetical protein